MDNAAIRPEIVNSTLVLISLSAVSGAPRDVTLRRLMVLEGRFRYSDLQEAALTEAYVL